MGRRSKNAQLFALPGSPPERLVIAGGEYRLVEVFKHDFFAATCLYEGTGAPGGVVPGQSATPRLVVKFHRTQAFCGFPLAWLGRFSRNHERAMYAALRGLEGVPRWVASLAPAGHAIEYIDGLPIDLAEALPAGFFDRLRAVFEGMHARGVAYVDANKRSNILIDRTGRPFVVDYQVSIRVRGRLARPLVRYLQRKDLYHLYKHKRRLAAGELTPPEELLSRRRGALHRLHAWLIRPYKAIRRRFLRWQYGRGGLTSPTAGLETRPQPEKNTWRRPTDED